jgi:hypothetical protein
VTVPLSRAEAEGLYGTASYFPDGEGPQVFYSVEEIMVMFPKIIGVRDTRTGEYHPNQSDIPFVFGN